MTGRAGIGEFLSEFEVLLRKYQEGNPQLKQRDKSRCPPDVDIEDGEYEKNQALRQALLALSKIEPQNALDNDEIYDYAGFFGRLYGGTGEFRHMYSKVCSVMYGFFDEDGKSDEGAPYRAINLANNMDIIACATREGNNESRVADCVKSFMTI